MKLIHFTLAASSLSEGPSNFPWRVSWEVIIPLKKKSDIEIISGKAVLWMKAGTLVGKPAQWMVNLQHSFNSTSNRWEKHFFLFHVWQPIPTPQEKHWVRGKDTPWAHSKHPIYYFKSSKSANVCVPLWKSHPEFNSQPTFKCLNIHIHHLSPTATFLNPNNRS